MMAGLLLASIGAGQIVSRTGKYRVFPSSAPAIMTVGLFSSPDLDTGTSAVAAAPSCSRSGPGSAW